MRHQLFIIVVFIIGLTSPAHAADEISYVRMETSMGEIFLALDKEKAPVTVDNFLTYARNGYYNRMIFHRVVPGRLIQGGGYSRSLYERPKIDPIVNEADNGLKNVRGAIAMARNKEPDSAQSQFFINLKDNTELDHQGKEYKFEWGYAVFGEVLSGMDVVDAISVVPTEGRGDFEANVPVDHVYINTVTEVSASDVPVSE